MASINVTLYRRPNGKKTTIPLTEITEEDAKYFNDNKIKVSLEPQDNGTDNIIIYADYGKRDEEGTPEEIIIFSRGREAIECMTELRQKVETALNSLKQEESDNE